LFRIALLILVGLFAHTVRANTRPIVPVRPPCPDKVAVAQPDPEKKLPPIRRQTVRPGRLVDSAHFFGGSFGFTQAQAAGLFVLPSAGQIAVTRWTVYVAPQRRPFALRI
jgi:hypothetical protein